MKSVFHHKPPKPKYLAVWDVTVVFKFLRSLMPLSRLSLKMLTFKTVALVSLATAPRAQTLVHMNIDNMVREKTAIIFLFKDILKTTRVGHSSFSLKIEHFEDESLCAMHSLLAYLEATKNHRQSSSVLVSYKTYKPVSTSTIARWLKSVLELSGIDSNVFKAHSYRSASTSAAFSKGCSLKTILETADWKSDKNFRKFYFRQSLSNSNLSFSKAVFDT